MKAVFTINKRYHNSKSTVISCTSLKNQTNKWLQHMGIYQITVEKFKSFFLHFPGTKKINRSNQDQIYQNHLDKLILSKCNLQYMLSHNRYHQAFTGK